MSISLKLRVKLPTFHLLLNPCFPNAFHVVDHAASFLFYTCLFLALQLTSLSHLYKKRLQSTCCQDHVLWQADIASYHVNQILGPLRNHESEKERLVNSTPVTRKQDDTLLMLCYTSLMPLWCFSSGSRTTIIQCITSLWR